MAADPPSSSLDLSLPIWGAFATLIKLLKLRMSSIALPSLCMGTGFNQECFRQLVVSAASQSGFTSIKQFSRVVVDGGQVQLIDLVLSMGGFSLIVDLGYVGFSLFKDLSHKLDAPGAAAAAAGGGKKKLLDPMDSLVQTYVESNATRSSRKLRTLQLQIKGGITDVARTELQSQIQVDSYLKGLKLMGGIDADIEGYCIGVTLFGLGNSFLVSAKTGGNKWLDRTEELMETAKDLPVRIYNRMGSGSSSSSSSGVSQEEMDEKEKQVSQLGGMVQSLHEEIDALKGELQSSHQITDLMKEELKQAQCQVDQQAQELSSLRWDSANVVALRAELDDIKSQHFTALAKLKERETENAALKTSLSSITAELYSSMTAKATSVPGSNSLSTVPDNVQDQIEDLESEISKHIETIEIKNTIINQLKQQIEASNTKAPVCNHHETEISPLTEAFHVHESTIIRLQTELSDITAKSPSDSTTVLPQSSTTTALSLLNYSASNVQNAIATTATTGMDSETNRAEATSTKSVTRDDKEETSTSQMSNTTTIPLEPSPSPEPTSTTATIVIMKNLESKLVEKEAELSSLSKSTQESLIALESLKAQHAQLFADHEKRGKKLRKREREVNELRAAAAAAAAAATRVSTSDASIKSNDDDSQDNNLNNETREKEEIVELESAVEALTTKNVDLETQLLEWNSKEETWKSTVDGLVADVHNLQTRVDELLIENSRLQDLENAVQNLEAKTQALTEASRLDKESICKLEVALADAVESERIKELETDKLKAEMDVARVELDGIKGMNIDLIVELGTIKSEREGLLGDLEKRKKKLKKKEKELDKLSQSVEKMTQEAVVANGYLGDNKKLIRGLEAKLNEARQVVEEQGKRIVWLESEMVERVSINEAFESLRAKMASVIDNTVTGLLEERRCS